MKKLTVFILSLSSYLSFAPSALAAEVARFSVCPPNPAGLGGINALCNLSLDKLIGPLITTIFIIAMVAALLYLVWGGFKWLTSGGDKAAVQAAREHIVAAIVGLVLVFASFLIINIIMNFFFGQGVSGSITLPSLNP